MEWIKHSIEYVAVGIEILGVLIITMGTLMCLIQFALGKKSSPDKTRFVALRHDLGKTILLGLEVLVAADIIATVITEATMDRVLVLGVVVLIRTFLSFSLELEIEGKWPWQRKPTGEMDDV